MYFLWGKKVWEKKIKLNNSSQIFSTENNYFYYKYKGYPAMQKFSCCKIVRTCVMDSFRGSHRPNFLYDETFHLGISRIQNCICTYINVMTKFIFKLSFVFFSIYKSITFLFSTVWSEKKLLLILNYILNRELSILS